MIDQPTSSLVLKDLCAMAKLAEPGIPATIHVSQQCLRILSADDYLTFQALHPDVKIEAVQKAPKQ